MTSSRRNAFSLLAASALVIGLSGSASALPATGTPAPAARVADPDGHVADLAAMRGKVSLVLYEDPSSTGQNHALVEELYARASVLQSGAPVAVIPVADVSAYDFWPMKSFASRAVRARAAKAGVHIYCDWKGTFRTQLGLERGRSNVVLIGRDGRVLFAAAGTLSRDQREHLFALATSEIGPRQVSASR